MALLARMAREGLADDVLSSEEEEEDEGDADADADTDAEAEAEAESDDGVDGAVAFRPRFTCERCGLRTHEPYAWELHERLRHSCGGR